MKGPKDRIIEDLKMRGSSPELIEALRQWQPNLEKLITEGHAMADALDHSLEMANDLFTVYCERCNDLDVPHVMALTVFHHLLALNMKEFLKASPKHKLAIEAIEVMIEKGSKTMTMADYKERR